MYAFFGAGLALARTGQPTAGPGSYKVAVFDRLLVRDGAIAEVRYREPFELIFNTTEFEQRRMERETGLEPATSTLGRSRSAR